MNKNKHIKKVIIQNSESNQQSDLPEIKHKPNKKEVLQTKKIVKQAIREEQQEKVVINLKKQHRDDSLLSKDKSTKQVISNSGPVRKAFAEKRKIQKQQLSEEEESQPEQQTKKAHGTKLSTKIAGKNGKKDMSKEDQSQQVQQQLLKTKVKQQTKKNALKKQQKQQQSDEQSQSQVKPKKVLKTVEIQKKKKVQQDQQSEDIIVNNKKNAISIQKKQTKQTFSEESSQQENKKKNDRKFLVKKNQLLLQSKNIKKDQLELQEEQQQKVKQKKSSKDIKKNVKRVVEQSNQEQTIKVGGKKNQSEIKSRKASKDSLKIIGKEVSVQEDEKGQFEACIMQISFNAYDQDIRDHFQQCGNILNVKLLTKPDGKSRGVAFIKFGSRSQLKKAIQLNGSDLMGRPIKVSQATKRQNNGSNNFKNDKQNNRGNDRGGSNFNNRENKFKDNSPAVIDNPNLFIGGLSFNSTQDSIKNFFSQCGHVVGARVVTDRQTRKPRGFGYVEFATVDQAKKAYGELNGQRLDGRNIRIDATQPRNKHQGGGDRGFSGGRGQQKNSGNSYIDLSIDEKNAKSGVMGTFQGKIIIL